MKKQDVLKYLAENNGVVAEFNRLKRADTVKKTFEVDKSLVEEFMTSARTRKLKIKDAVDEALREWIRKRPSSK